MSEDAKAYDSDPLKCHCQNWAWTWGGETVGYVIKKWSEWRQERPQMATGHHPRCKTPEKL